MPDIDFNSGNFNSELDSTLMQVKSNILLQNKTTISEKDYASSVNSIGFVFGTILDNAS